MSNGGTKLCSTCNGLVPSNRHKYCDSCKLKKSIRLCIDCGQPNNVPSSKFCLQCREKRLPIWQRADDSRLNGGVERQAITATPKCTRSGCSNPLPSARHRVCDSCKGSPVPKGAGKAVKNNASTRKANELNRFISIYGHKMFVDGNKFCPGCATYRHVSDFGKSKTSAHGLQTMCVLCSHTKAFERRLKTVYGMSMEEYDAVLEKQNGACAICKNKPKKMRLAVDHDHKSGKVRGLLCSRCNHKLLGSANDSTKLLYSAIEYLESPPADFIGVTVPEEMVKGRKRRRK